MGNCRRLRAKKQSSQGLAGRSVKFESNSSKNWLKYLFHLMKIPRLDATRLSDVGASVAS